MGQSDTFEDLYSEPSSNYWLGFLGSCKDNTFRKQLKHDVSKKTMTLQNSQKKGFQGSVSFIIIIFSQFPGLGRNLNKIPELKSRG